MGRTWGSLALALIASLSGAQEPEPLGPPGGKIIKDLWDAAYLDGHRAGYVRLKVEEVTAPNGQKLIRSSQQMDLRVRRGREIAQIAVVTGTDETPEGQVREVFMIQGLGQNISQELRGRVEGQELIVKAVGQANFEKRIRWNPRVVSALGES
jgi:hypothetical protein